MGLPSAEAAARRDHRHRQREHARRPAAGQRAAGLRPAGLRAGRLRRRRTVARQRDRRADRRLAGDRPAVTRRALRAGRRHHLAAGRVGPHLSAPVLRPDRRRAAGDPDRRCPTSASDRLAAQGLDAGRAADRLRGRRPLLRAGFRDPDHHRPGVARATWTGSLPRLGDRPSTPSTSGCSPSCSAPTTSWSTPGHRSAARARRSPPPPLPSRATAIRPRPAPGPPRSTCRAPSPTPPIYDRLRAAGRRRDHRAGHRRRDGLDHAGPARAHAGHRRTASPAAC